MKNIGMGQYLQWKLYIHVDEIKTIRCEITSITPLTFSLELIIFFYCIYLEACISDIDLSKHSDWHKQRFLFMTDAFINEL